MTLVFAALGLSVVMAGAWALTLQAEQAERRAAALAAKLAALGIDPESD